MYTPTYPCINAMPLRGLSPDFHLVQVTSLNTAPTPLFKGVSDIWPKAKKKEGLGKNLKRGYGRVKGVPKRGLENLRPNYVYEHYLLLSYLLEGHNFFINRSKSQI